MASLLRSISAVARSSILSGNALSRAAVAPSSSIVRFKSEAAAETRRNLKSKPPKTIQTALTNKSWVML
ncbi:AAEL010840-PA [Aedes aegypti]|uniref:AAEL010840-PA n=1 Tax=Aedes aegypti TaxID=7159 RepID=Q16RV1_AEDAE|nr:AAEL010840-PA [Aedes aegypti]